MDLVVLHDSVEYHCAMLARPRVLLLLPLAALLGCGSSSSPSSISATPYDFNGSWNAVYPSGAPLSMPFTNLGGPLQVSSSGAVTGTLTASAPYNSNQNPNLCAANNTPLVATGTLDAAHDLVLTFPIAGGTGTLVATLADDPATDAYGSWQVNGGACAMSATQMAIAGTPSTPYTPSSTAPPAASLSGNWVASVDANVTAPHPIAGFGGPLQFTNGSVSGILTATASANSIYCQQTLVANPTAAATGTLDSNNNLTLTVPVAGGTATITATLGSNPQTLADGSFQIVGGPCAVSATPMTIAQHAPVTGTYTGTFNLPATGNVPTPGSNITVTAVLTQSPTFNGNVVYPITGTVTVTGACTESATLAPGTVAGNAIYSADFGSNNQLAGPQFTGLSNPSASSILNATFQDAAAGGACSAAYQGILTLQ